MKRAFVYGIGVMLLMLSTGNVWAQSDDVYYDPKKDADYNQPTNPDNYDNNSGYNNQDALPATDKTDGYITPSDNYDSPSQTSSSQYSDGSGNTYITNNYYDNDEDFYYTNRLNRYYRPNWGMDYYSYQFTPSYYGGYGYNGWNRGISISFGTWYNDPWSPWGNSFGYGFGGGWNDPWRSPYWGWNMGWNNCSYYNSWYDPWYGGGFCSTPYMFGGYGGGWGGYGYGYNQGYYNGYYNGYNDGYYAGGYGGGQTGNGYYNQGPRRNRTLLETTRTSDGGLVTTNGPRGGLTGRTGMEIPREGIARPIDRPASGNINEPNRPSQPSREVLSGREIEKTNSNPQRPNTPNTGNTNNTPPTRWEGRPVEQPNRANPNVQPTRPTTPNNGEYERNVQPRDQVQPSRPQPSTPRENVQPNRPQPNVAPRENVQPNRPQPRQEMQSRPQPQPRQEMQQRPQPQMQPRPQYQPQPQQQMQPRPSSPSPSGTPRGNMGGGRRGG